MWCYSSCGSESQLSSVDSLLHCVQQHAEKTERFYTERQYTNAIPPSFYRPKIMIGWRNAWSMKWRVPDQEDLERGCAKRCLQCLCHHCHDPALSCGVWQYTIEYHSSISPSHYSIQTVSSSHGITLLHSMVSDVSLGHFTLKHCVQAWYMMWPAVSNHQLTWVIIRLVLLCHCVVGVWNRQPWIWRHFFLSRQEVRRRKLNIVKDLTCVTVLSTFG